MLKDGKETMDKAGLTSLELMRAAAPESLPRMMGGYQRLL